MSPVVIGLVCLWCCTVLVSGQASLARAQTTPRPELSDAHESPPLTAVQEEARQLVGALRAERAPRAETAPAAPQRIVVEPPPAEGERPVILHVAIRAVAWRLVGGEQTLRSPVAETTAATAADANRPLFLPATHAAVAADMLFE
jgi:hypothetical protein